MSKHKPKISKEDKKRRRNSIILGSILIFLMTFGIVGYGFTANSNTNHGSSYANFSYNNYEFRYATVNNNNIFVGIINGQEVPFYNHPADIENITVSDSFKENALAYQSIVFSAPTLSPEENIGQDQIYFDYLVKDLQTSSGKNIIRGMLSKDLFNDYPVYNCESATQNQPVLVLKSESDSGLPLGIYDTDKEYCYDLVASGLNVIKMRDKLLYIFTGVQ